MKKTIKNGFTVLELLITVAIVAIVGVAFVGFATSSFSVQDTKQLENDATEFAKGLGYTVRGASCTNQDSDDDGYVSCTIATNKGDDILPMAVECGSNTFFSRRSGCRLQRGVFTAQ